jgi:NADH-ubiquinone oxidoreductase chain 5
LWEGVGICSYLLISFWFSRIQATKAALQAMVFNRIADWGLTIGLLLIFFVFGNFEFTTIFSLAPYINVEVITMTGIALLMGVMGKSSQLGLHPWLPSAYSLGEFIN